MNDISEHIAIIGMTCRFPKAKNLDEFWQNLRDGVESVSFFTNEELVAQGIDPAVLNDPNYVKANAVLEDIDLFDASFFDLTPREAEITDPQHRLFLECASEVLESSGYNPDTYAGRIGVYAGAGASTYLLHNLLPNSDVVQTVSSFQLLMGSNKDFMPTRVSYKLNLKGPSVNVSTACSTSLVAVQMACQSLLDYHCDMALAGGVGIQLPQKQGYLYQESGINSPDGHCRAFDAKAKGTVNGNGVGIVVLKRLEDALEDGDSIHAVIIGSAVNNDGAAKVGYTAPSVEGQTDVIAEAQAVAKVDPETISYIETHGTGTALGDPIEIEALTQAFRLHTQKKGFCAIGSVKSNFGHLDEAAGVAGLIKTVLALKHRQIPPSLHFEQPNPEIDFANSPFFVNNTLSDWKTDGTPRRAGVSSFGIGGTNAHLIIEEAPHRDKSSHSRSWQLLILSAKTRSALDTATTHLATHLKQHPSTHLADVAYTLQVGRRIFNHKRVILCQTNKEAVLAQSLTPSGRIFTDYHEPKERPIAFMFSGQGTQYVNMGLELYQTEPTFREQIDICAEILKPHLKLDLRQLWYPNHTEAKKLEQTAIAQPTLFVIEYALAKLWMSYGIKPQAMIGHSIGEYVAACLAEVFSLEDALALVATRGKMMQQLPHGAMLAVALSPAEAQPLLDKGLDMAAVNEPARCVVSGSIDTINALEKKLKNKEIESRRLHTSHAFHSEMMTPILESFAQRVKQVRLQVPKIPYISNVSGTWITAEQATDPNYYAQHLRKTVRFADGVQQLLQEPNRILLEVGAGRTLTSFAQRHPDKKPEQVVLSSIRHPQDNQSDVAFLLTTLGKLWLAGVKIDWAGFYANEQRHRLPLPTYPFERQRYWVEAKKTSDVLKTSDVSTLSGKKPDIADWFYIPSWKRSLLPQTSDVFKTSDVYNWLLFIDECNLGTQLAKRLQQAGQKIITVQVGTAFTQLGENTFSLNPENADDYKTLFRELHTREKMPKRIVHLWNVTTRTETGIKIVDIEAVDKAQYLGFYSLLFLAQAIGEQDISDDIQLSVLSNNMQAVVGETVRFPEKASVLGPIKVIRQEYPNIHCRSIDINFLPSQNTYPSKENAVVEPLIAELTTKVSDPVIAYRENQRWVQTFEPLRLEKSGKTIPRLRTRGVYLITGGLGGIGLELAAHLAKTVQARLILIGRSAFPSKKTWNQWLSTHDPHDHVSQKIRKLQEIEALGAEIFVASANVANRQQMQTVITETKQQFGSINGVIHAAGVPDGALIPRQTRDMTETVLAPKIKGTLVLDSFLQDVELDFFILCSALTSILGTFGQVCYCAANAFLDAFAHFKANKGNRFTVAINWDAWQKVGMAVETANWRAGMIEKLPSDSLNRSKETRTVYHPLFDECIIEGKDQEKYISHLNVSKHWVLHEHRITGKATLPGTAYLELARAAFEPHAQSGQIEIKEIYFLSPLIVEENENKEVHTILKKQGDSFEFVISTGPETWQEHTRGIIARRPTQPIKKHDIKAIERQCHQQEIIISGLAQKSQAELSEFEARLKDFGPRWYNLQRVNLGVNQGLAVLELSDDFATDMTTYSLHPALLDIATGFMALHNPDYGGLPFSYKGLIIKAPLPAKIYSYVRYADRQTAQTLKFNVTIIDEQGRELLEIEEYTLRQVTTETAFDKPLNRNFCLEIGSPGFLDTLTFKPALRQPPGPDEVEIEVYATGLNFKEVLYALGLLPSPPDFRVKFGLECAGKIVTVGQNVKDFQKGDEVIAFAPASFSAFTTTSATSVAPKPDNLSFEEAATIPAAFMTAYYALIIKGQLSKGERVLIHAAAGGVGMAAVKIAQWVGAEIFATAGNPEKRAFLHSQGIKYVMDSRSLTFAEEVMEYTGGVDVVLNSLGGEFISKSLETLAPFGRFLELGIRDIYNNTQLGLRPFEKNLSFTVIGVGPELPQFNSILREVVEHFNRGHLTPIEHQVFPITKVVNAFEYMAQAKHIGKIVVSMADKAALTTFQDRIETSNGSVNREAAAKVYTEKNFLKDGLLPTEGIEIFNRILGAGQPQIIVSKRDFIKRLEQNNAFSIKQLDKERRAELTYQRPVLETAYTPPRNETEQTLAEIWQKVLGIAQVGIHDDFFDLNGDSLLAAQVISRLHKAFKINLPMSSIFDDSTVAGLAKRIEKLLPQLVHTATDEEEGEI
jgi:acyl transferase domain-containing protein/acyl carrier protein